MKSLSLMVLLTALIWAQPIERLKAASKHVGDHYDAAYVAGGRPPRGRSACVDVLVSACRAQGRDLQELIQQDASCGEYPLLRDRNIDHRWAPNLKVWMRRHLRSLPWNRDFQPGDFVFWSLTGDGVADHCGVISDRKGASGKWMVIHQFPPRCLEEDCLGRWQVAGHYRM